MKIKYKKVVYLFGAGSTQAEVNISDNSIKVLAKHIAEGMLNRIDSDKIKNLYEIKNDLAHPNIDVEQLLTLYESTNNRKFKRISSGLRRIYKEEIENRLSLLGDNYVPKILTALIDMHEIEDLPEKLAGIITINYEDFIERAFKEVKGEEICVIDM